MASNTAVVFTKIMEGLKAVYSEARIHESMQRDNPIPLDQVLTLRQYFFEFLCEQLERMSRNYIIACLSTEIYY